MSPQRPEGLRERAYRRLIQYNTAAERYVWSVMRINPKVYARGRVRHPDHKTIVLREWHEVLMNTENSSDTMRNVAFID